MQATSETTGSHGLRQVRYDFVLEAETPIAHHAESIGNEAIAMRRKVRQFGGWASPGVITADTMRHGVREAGAYALLDALGALESPALTEAATRLLFAGGAMGDKSDKGTVKLDEWRQLCEMVPSMAMLGGCTQSQINPGRVNVEDATLICAETRKFVPPHAVEFAESVYGDLEMARAHIEEVQRVRMDPMLSPEKRLLLSGGEQVKILARMTASEKASEEKDGAEAERAKSSMMPRRFERLAQGSLFFWRITANCYGPLDVDVLHVMVAAFLANARVGGKRGTGHGSIRALKGWGIELARPRDAMASADPAALAPSMGKLFRAHVEERKGRIVDFLASVHA